MNIRHSWPCALLGALVLSAPAAQAQERPVELALKVRYGYQLGSAKDNLAPRTLGFGVEASRKIGPGRLGLELGWQLKSGNQYRVDPQDSASIESKAGQVLMPTLAADSRKNEMDGLMGRLTWQQSLNADFALTFGLQAGGTRFRQEYMADIQTAAQSAPGTAVSRDTYNGALSEGKFNLSPLVGVSWRLDEGSSLELNIVALRYQALNYLHRAGYVAGTNNDTSRDEIVRTNRTVPHFELGYVLRF